MIIAQLSDFHARPHGRPAYGVIDTNAAIGRAIDAVLAMPLQPDCVLVTGDLTDCGLAEEYAIVRDELARLPMPVYLVPGNHDRRESFLAALSEQRDYLPSDGPLNYVIEDFPVRLIGLDTLVPGESGGALSPASEAWLAETLADGAGRPTLVFMHHPPFRVAVDGMDGILCRVSPGFAGLIAKHPEIERIVFRIKERGITTIIVEQNAVAALRLADRAVILDTGELVFAGAARELLESEDLRNEYLAI